MTHNTLAWIACIILAIVNFFGGNYDSANAFLAASFVLNGMDDK